MNLNAQIAYGRGGTKHPQIPIMKTLTITTLLLAATPAMAQDESHSANWYADFDQAAIVAKEQGKDLLIDFTGSDW